MGLITKEVEIEVSRNAKWFEDKGCQVPRVINSNKINVVKRGTKIIVKVEDLPEGSGALVNVECDGCGKELPDMKWSNYKKYLHEDNKYYCQQCAKNGYVRKINFKEWCYENLPKEEADTVMLRWDNNLNVDKNGIKIKPEDIIYSSNGLDRKGCWFKCLDHPEHESELKSIYGFTSDRKGSLNCNQCNSILTIYPNLVIYLINNEDKHLAIRAGRTIQVRCPNCGFEKSMKVYTLTGQGMSCRCGDKKPYPEKFMYSFLHQLKEDFITELTKTTFSWCKNYRYDNYINNVNCIIETHGKQHYEETTGKWGSLKDRQQNDIDKEQLAKEKGIEHYIIINCRKSEMDWIKNSIMNSKLPKLLNFNEEDIDWLKCHEHAITSNIVKMTCNLWNKGITTSEMMPIFKMGKSAIIRYLKQGNKLGWCNYDSEVEIKNNLTAMSENNCKQVICLTTKEVFNSLIEAGLKYNIKAMRIGACCSKNNKTKTAGEHPNTKKRLIWMYYDEYLINNKVFGWYDEYMKNYICDNKTSKIICLTTNETFDSIAEASRKYKINKVNISQCCGKRNNTKSAGLHPNTGEKMVWMYYDEYILKTEEEIKNILNNVFFHFDKRIICLTTNEIFNSQKEAGEKYKIFSSSISSCCSHKLNYAGKHPETGEKMVWAYLENS